MCLYRVDAVDYAANLAQKASRMAAFNELYGEDTPETVKPTRRRASTFLTANRLPTILPPLTIGS